MTRNRSSDAAQAAVLDMSKALDDLPSLEQQIRTSRAAIKLLFAPSLAGGEQPRTAARASRPGIAGEDAHAMLRANSFRQTEDETMPRLLALAIAALLFGTASPVLAQQGQGGPPGMQQRFQEMQQMRRQMYDSQSPGQRQQFRRQHRQLMQEQMRAMDDLPRPGPQATPEERLRYMEERHAIMEQMMREMIEQPPTEP